MTEKLILPNPYSLLGIYNKEHLMRIFMHFQLSTMYAIYITMPIRATLHSKVELLEWTFLLQSCLQQVVMGSMYFGCTVYSIILEV